MKSINEITNVFIMLITVGAVARMMFYSIKIFVDEEEKEINIQRVKKLLIAVAVVMSIGAIKNMIEYYFK